MIKPKSVCVPIPDQDPSVRRKADQSGSSDPDPALRKVGGVLEGMMTILNNRNGSATFLFFGLVFVLLLMTFLIVEMGATLENYGYAESVLQRACNSAVEKNIDNAYRADHILLMDTEGAAADFRAFAAADLPSKYKLRITSIQCSASPPAMTVIGTITFDTAFAQYGFDEITHSVKVVSTNYELD